MKATLRTLFAASLLTIAAGCALLQPLGADDDARRAAKITLTAYEATQQGLIIYGRLPTCDDEAGLIRLCKDAKLWTKIKVVEKAATTAIVEAEPVLNGTKADAGELLAATVAIANVHSAITEARTKLKD